MFDFNSSGTNPLRIIGPPFTPPIWGLKQNNTLPSFQNTILSKYLRLWSCDWSSVHSYDSQWIGPSRIDIKHHLTGNSRLIYQFFKKKKKTTGSLCSVVIWNDIWNMAVKSESIIGKAKTFVYQDNPAPPPPDNRPWTDPPPLQIPLGQ